MSNRTTLSVIVPARSGAGDPLEACAAVQQALQHAGILLEFVVVLDGSEPELEARARQWKASGERVRIVLLGTRPGGAARTGEAAAIKAGLGFATGRFVLTLPADLAVAADCLPAMVGALERNDLVVAVRPRKRRGTLSPAPGPSSRAPVRPLFGMSLRDLECGVRVGRREVFAEIPYYGGHDRFLPVLADRLGFRVAAVETPMSGDGDRLRRTRGRGDTVGLLDLLAMFFLTRFSRKPLRFFGLLGAPLFGIGLIAFVYLLYIKIFHDQPLANRPLLLLAVLLLVLGAQVIALGLVAEIIVFTHLRDVHEYSVEEIVDGLDDRDATAG